jgi:hypothetical protein
MRGKNRMEIDPESPGKIRMAPDGFKRNEGRLIR